jgi:DNA-binding NarL/FixJ family response regulator
MKLLLVEDDDNKQRELVDFLGATYPKLQVEVAGSLISALRAMKENRPEIVLLDMTLPNYDVREGESGGGLHAFGGEEFLRQTRRFKLPTTVIVITQFESFGDPPTTRDWQSLTES